MTKEVQSAVDALTPKNSVSWIETPEARVYRGHEEIAGNSRVLISDYVAEKKWVWPERKIYFFCDLHGDREAFLRSLLATGEVSYKKDKLKISSQGKEAKFVLGGDLFDKGPSNFDLLDLICELRAAGADVDILAGNHDIRTFVGIHYMGDKDIKTAHLFSRMGGKSLTLFKEIYHKFQDQLKPCPYTEEDLIELMFPDETWLKEFPYYALDIIHPLKLKKETKRIREKIQEIQETTKSFGMTLQNLWSCVMKAREIFLEPGGEYHWVFETLELAKIYGSFIFVHGGLDDEILPELFEKNEQEMRHWFHKELKQDAFDLYHGPIGNCFRTKYRKYDHPLTKTGVEQLHQRGIYAVVHGHLNQRYGQRLVYRENMLHFQCDCSLDCNTRKKENISNLGMAVTIFYPEGKCEAISSDYDKIKVFSTKGLSQNVIRHPERREDKLVKQVFKEKFVSKPKKNKFNHESIEDTESIIKYFEAISDGFRNGGLQFGNGDKLIKLMPKGLLKFKVNAGKKDDKMKLNLQLEWKEENDSLSEPSDLLIQTIDDKETDE